MSLIEKSLKSKAVGTVVLGGMFAVIPSVVLAWLDAEASESTILFVRLFGLLAVALGFDMLLSKGSMVPVKHVAITNLLCDLAAVILLVLATSGGILNWIGYVLAAIYANSALIYSMIAFGKKS